MPMIGARFYAYIDNLHVRGDILENELAKVSYELRNYFFYDYEKKKTIVTCRKYRFGTRIYSHRKKSE